MMAKLNPLDWLLVVLLAYSMGRAALRGLVRECFALAGMLAGFVLACWYYQNGARLLGGLITTVPVAQFVAFLLTLFVVTGTATLLGTLLNRTATLVGLGLLNRAAGGVFGLLRGVLLGGALLLALTAFLPASPWVAGSQLAPYLLRATHAVSFVMPRELVARLAEARSRLKHTAPGWIKPPRSSHTT